MILWGQQLKKFILRHIRSFMEEKVEFYFFYCLGIVKDKIEFAEVHQYELVMFLGNCLSRYSGTPESYYIYDLLISLLKKYPILGSEIYGIVSFKYLEKVNFFVI